MSQIKKTKEEIVAEYLTGKHTYVCGTWYTNPHRILLA